MLVYIEDADQSMSGKPKYCRKGIRLFCKKYGLDYLDFRLNGMDSKILEDIGDSMGLKAIEVARGRQQ